MRLVLAATVVAGASTLLLHRGVDAKSSNGGGGGGRGEKKSNEVDPSQCGLYLAESSTSTAKEPKWGLFAGRDMEAGTPVGFGDVAVHVFNLTANNVWVDPETKEVHDSLDTNPLANVVDWLEQFVWVPHSSGGQFELAGEHTRIVTAVPGGGVLGSFNPKLTNADWNQSSAYHREAWNERPGEAHPGRGAYTGYYNLELATTEVVPAGKEIFIEYGENWEDEKGETKKKELLTKKDYDKLDQTIEKMVAFFQKYESDLDEASKEEIYQFLLKDVMAAAAGAAKGGQIAGMLPTNPAELKNVLETGGSFHLSTPNVVRTLSWLETNGRCFDNIRPGPSTIPYAGRGAFATRDIKEGGLVAPVPLVQVPLGEIMDMHKITTVGGSDNENDDEEDEVVAVRDGNETVGKQLLLNYCWGHPESDMLFFPTGGVVSYINHSKEKVNARMVWSDHPNNHKDWFDTKPADMIQKGHHYSGLMMEIVATKDIQQGDEVFLDYGDEWQAAWDKHVKEWEQEKGVFATWPIRALDLNQQHKSTFFRTKGEEPAYPDNGMLKCFLMVNKPPDGEPTKDDQGNKIRIWAESESGKSNLVSDNLFDCELVTRMHNSTDGSYSYDAVWSSGKSTTVVKGVPQKAIVFLDKPGTGDQHVKAAFRPWIGIPDDVFPQGPWRDAASEGKQAEAA